MTKDEQAVPRVTSVTTERPSKVGAADRSEIAVEDSTRIDVPASTTAIIAWHGMGQQLKFETVETVTHALASHERRTHGYDPAVTARHVELGGQKLWRAELVLHDREKRPHPVHVYEAYWAPLTEGKITLAETMGFLVRAAYNGFRYALLPPRVLDRYLFGRWVTFALKARLALSFFLILATLASLILVNFVVSAAATVKLVTDPTRADGWPSYALLTDLTIDLAWLAAAFAVLAVTFFIAYRSQRRNLRDAIPSQRRGVLRGLIWLLVGVSIVVTLGVGLLVADHLIVHSSFRELLPSWLQWQFATQLLTPASGMWARRLVFLGALLVWGAVFGGSAIVRWFVLEFVGDVAIYVSSHKLNRFYDTREAIKECSLATAGAIYKFGGYDRHILMGHSLGSAIAYDTLNRLTNDDILAGGSMQIRTRTALFLTFGSILDKTAFLFRTQSVSDDVREALASTTQPLISDPDARPPWVNLYSLDDVLGGSLEDHDVCNGTSSPTVQGPALPPPIDNRNDRNAWIPVLGHDQYWMNDLLLNTLTDAITRRDRPAVV